MMKESLMFAGGVAVGAVVIYGAYRYYQHHKSSTINNSTENAIFTAKLKEKEEKTAKLAELVSNQTYVELLTSKELTTWFRDNILQIGKNAKMMIVTPTEEHMGGLGYPTDNDLDVNTNVLQLIFEDSENNTIKVLKTRLINFTDIDSNLQAHLIEENGMLIVTV